MADSRFSPEEWRSLRHAYSEKNALSEAAGLTWWPPGLFYRELWPVGSLQSGPQDRHDGRGHGIAVEISHGPGGKPEAPVARRTFIDDDLREVGRLAASSAEQNSFVFCSPVSYWGKARTAANARELFAFVVDLDGVGVDEWRRLLVHCCTPGGLVPQPTFVVNSGTGAHVYYLLDRPVPLKPYVRPALQELKRRLTDRVWNDDTSHLSTKQYQGIFQGFRMVGCQTRLNGSVGNPKQNGYEAVAWRFGSTGQEPRRWSIEALAEAVYSRIGKAGKKEFSDFLALARNGGRTPASDAAARWPDWYQRRVVDGQPRRGWVTNRALYDKHLQRIIEGVQVHHRYWCIYTLAAAANKCGVSAEELERDALSLMPVLMDKDLPGNEFTLSDLYAALEGYDGGDEDSPARRTTVSFVRRVTGLDIPAGPPRRGRTRAQSLEIARHVQSIDDPEGWWRNEDGAPEKKMLVWQYAYAHPGASHAAVARGAGVSRTTAIKWLRVPDWEGEYLRLLAASSAQKDPYSFFSDPGWEAEADAEWNSLLHRSEAPLSLDASESSGLLSTDVPPDPGASVRVPADQPL